MPLLQCGFWFNRKRHQTEIALRQIRSEERDRNNASITVRITELDATYDHVVSLDDGILLTPKTLLLIIFNILYNE